MGIGKPAGWAHKLGLGNKEARAWAMYDWANSAFATTIMAGFLPVYYSQVAASHLPDTVATAYWGYTTAIALALIAVLAPVLGAVADYMGAKKRFLAGFMGFGVTFTALLYFIGEGDWLLASAIFIVANIGFAGANVFYEALLPSVARDDEMDRVSTAGYAVGYLGGGVLLALNAAWYLFPESFGFTDDGQAVRASFVSVAIWWALFSLPLFRRVPEPDRRLGEGETVGLNPARVGFSRVLSTLREIRRHRDLFLFLLAFLIYNDGVGTIIKMATIYGDEVGIGTPHLIGALLLVQFVGIPFTFAFGQLAARMSAKNGILRLPGRLLGDCRLRLLHERSLAVLGTRGRRGHGARGRSGFESLAVCEHDPGRPIDGVLRLLQRELEVRRHRRPAGLRGGGPVDGHEPLGHPVARRLLRRRGRPAHARRRFGRPETGPPGGLGDASRGATVGDHPQGSESVPTESEFVPRPPLEDSAGCSLAGTRITGYAFGVDHCIGYTGPVTHRKTVAPCSSPTSM